MADPYAHVRPTFNQPYNHSFQPQSSTPPPPNTAESTSSSSDSSSTATLASAPDTHPPQIYPSPIGFRPTHSTDAYTSPATQSPNPQATPSNDDIEAAIQAATNSSVNIGPLRSSPSGASGKGSTSDGRSIPPRDTRTQLFVGNLPYRVRWQDLKDLFRRAGTVLRADVSLGADNRSRGYGTVLLATAEDAGRAIDMFNGYEWQTRMLEVRVDRVGGHMPESSAITGMAPPVGGVQVMTTGIYMPPQQQTQNFLTLASQFNAQPSTQASLFNVQPQGPTQQQQIYAPKPQAVTMSHFQAHLQAHAQSQSQYEHLQQQYFGQQPQPHQNPPSIPGRTLFVGNLPYHVQWQDLKDLFRRTPGGATILRADVALGPDGRSKGFGTVTLRTEEETERAKRWFSGYEFNGRQLKVHHDRIPVSSVQSPILSNSLPAASASPSLLSQQIAMLGLSEALADQHFALAYMQRPTSSSPTTGSASSRHQYVSQSSKLRSESLISQSSSHTSAAVRSPLLRQIHGYQQDGMHQPSPLHSSTSLGQSSPSSPANAAVAARHGRSHSSSISSSNDGLMQTSRPGLVTSTTSLSVSPNPPSSPSVSRANRPTHIVLPAPSFHFDFDPSMASLDSLDTRSVAGYEGDKEFGRGTELSRSISRGSGSGKGPDPEPSIQPLATPLQMHFRNQEKSSEEQEYQPVQFQKHNQLYQLLHGSRQLALMGGGSSSSKPQQQKHSDSPTGSSQPTKSVTSSSGVSAASSAASLLEEFERSFVPNHLGGLRESRSSGASSAEGSSRSLPLGLGAGGLPGVFVSKRALTREASPDKGDAIRPLSTASTTGSTTSASESGMSTSLSGSSRTGSSIPTGHHEPENGSPSKGQLPEIERQERSPRPHHPGSITLPPLPQVVFPLSNYSMQAVASGPSDLSEMKVGSGLFQQYHPFAMVDAKDAGDSADFDYSGVPTVQGRHVQSYANIDGGYPAQRRKEAARGQEVQQWNDAQVFRQQQVLQYGQPSMMHLTPHGLPPMTPSMPPFNPVNMPQAPYHPPGIYPSLPIGHRLQRGQQQPVNPPNRARQHPNAPGTLSLPPQQLVFMPGQHSQSPMLSPASTIGPGTAPMQHVPYLHPLGSPGSPYALGPHHPLLQTQQGHYQPTGYGHMPHPLSHSFGGAGVPAQSSGMGAMSPYAPWGRPGEYVNPAVGVPPVHRASGSGGKDRTRSRSRSIGNDGGSWSQQRRPSRAGGGHWVSGHPDMAIVEPKGYFDQLYMDSSEGAYGGEPDEVGGDRSGKKRAEEQRAVEREIMKDKGGDESASDKGEEGTASFPRPPLLESRSSQSTKASDFDHESWRSTSAESSETPATTDDDENDDGEFGRLQHNELTLSLGGNKSSPPGLHHSKTDPTHAKGARPPETVRRSTVGEES